MDSISERRLSEVHPRLASLIRQLAGLHAAEFPDNALRVTQGLRTWAEQDELYAQGRTAPGEIVTKAPAGHSQHNFGLAIDIVPLDNHGVPIWDNTLPVWKRLIALAQGLGLESGAIWKTLKDYPHLQLTGSWPVSPDDAQRSAYASGGIGKVWADSGLPSMPDDIQDSLSGVLLRNIALSVVTSASGNGSRWVGNHLLRFSVLSAPQSLLVIHSIQEGRLVVSPAQGV